MPTDAAECGVILSTLAYAAFTRSLQQYMERLPALSERRESNPRLQLGKQKSGA